MARSSGGVVALDAGGATLKASVVRAGAPSSVSVVANYGATPASGGPTVLGKDLAALEQQRARLNLVRPIERHALVGYCVNWNVEAEIYAHVLSQHGVDVAPSEHALVATAPLLAPTVVNESMDQVVFEELGFQAFARVNAPEMCVLSYAEHCRRESVVAAVSRSPAKKRRKRASASPAAGAKSHSGPSRLEDLTFGNSSCHLVVDAGFSFTHVVPVVDGRALLRGVKRVNVGGKLLTNYLKEVLSFRQLDVKSDTRVVDELKHALCYCSTDFDADMRRLHRDRSQRKRWVLPDYVTAFRGRELNDDDVAGGGDDDAQTLEMGVEMVAVPEVLFHPSDIGLDQAGIAEAIEQSVRACPEHLHGALLDNILLVGGSSKFRGFRERLEQDVRPLVPDDYRVTTFAPPDPILAAWQGCEAFARTDALEQRQVTKQEYDEHGSNVCRQRFQ